jgi:anthranilate phosphoribosyltransferase
MVGFARAMRERAVPLPRPIAPVFDTCGTGGDGASTFNVSTAAAIVVAGAGVRVAKHGNRAVSSRCGSADVFEALGINLEAPADRVVAALNDVGLAFFFAPAWHPSMRHAGPTRRELGVRTAFNLLGPLTNPAGAKRQVIGVSRPEHTELVARTLGLLGAERAWVVHGAGGLDELSTLGHTKVSELRNGMVNTFWIHPADVGLRTAASADLAGGDAAGNAALIDAILGGETGPRRDVVLLNAGAALLVAEAASSLADGIQRAAAAVDDGRARTTLARMKDLYAS